LPFPPPHPGEVLREDVLPALGMQVKELADHLGVSRQSLSYLLHEKRAVSVEMAQRLGQAFQNGARFWLALRRAQEEHLGRPHQLEIERSLADELLRWPRSSRELIRRRSYIVNCSRGGPHRALCDGYVARAASSQRRRSLLHATRATLALRHARTAAR